MKRFLSKLRRGGAANADSRGRAAPRRRPAARRRCGGSLALAPRPRRVRRLRQRRLERRRERRDDRPGRLLDSADRLRGVDRAGVLRDARRLRGRLPELVRRLRRPVARGRGRPAGRRRAPAARAGHDPSGRGGPDRRRATPTPSTTAAPRTRSSSSSSGRATRRGSTPGTTWSPASVEVITPNPFTSGGARWNMMAAYGSQIEQGKSEEEALAFVQQVLENTPVQDASARDALQTFIGGKGDVLLSYENEAIGAIDAGEELDYVVPDETILIETQAAVTTEADDPEAAQAFLDFQISDEGQRLWAENGYRPVEREDPRRVLGRVPRAEEPVHDRGLRRLGDGRRPSSSIRPRVRSPRSSAISGWQRSESRGRCHCQGTPEAEPSARPRGPGPHPRPRRRLPQPDGAAADRGGRRDLARGRHRRLLGRGHRAPGRRRAEADRDRVADRRRHQRDLRHARSPGSWSATSSPASASSTRSSTCRSRCRRSSPGSTLLALYGETGILGLSGVSFTRVGVVMALLFVTLPFVIRSVQPVLMELDAEMEEAAASLGRAPVHDLPPRHPAEPGPGDRRRRARSPSPARSASSARWC